MYMLRLYQPPKFMLQACSLSQPESDRDHSYFVQNEANERMKQAAIDKQNVKNKRYDNAPHVWIQIASRTMLSGTLLSISWKNAF